MARSWRSGYQAWCKAARGDGEMTDQLGNGALRGKRALVTGAGAGIGRAAALRLAGNGASVALVDWRADELHAAVAEVEGPGESALVFVVAVGEENDIAATFEAVEASWGGLDCVVVCAGISLYGAGEDRVDRLEVRRAAGRG